VLHVEDILNIHWTYKFRFPWLPLSNEIHSIERMSRYC